MPVRDEGLRVTAKIIIQIDKQIRGRDGKTPDTWCNKERFEQNTD